LATGNGDRHPALLQRDPRTSGPDRRRPPVAAIHCVRHPAAMVAASRRIIRAPKSGSRLS
jgi:hypothetical protein